MVVGDRGEARGLFTFLTPHPDPFYYKSFYYDEEEEEGGRGGE